MKHKVINQMIDKYFRQRSIVDRKYQGGVNLGFERLQIDLIEIFYFDTKVSWHVNSCLLILTSLD